MTERLYNWFLRNILYIYSYRFFLLNHYICFLELFIKSLIVGSIYWLSIMSDKRFLNQRRIQNSVEHLRWSFLQNYKIISKTWKHNNVLLWNSWNYLIFVKKFFWIVSLNVIFEKKNDLKLFRSVTLKAYFPPLNSFLDF